jgi:DNA-binding GntR family transcriptional regulator
MRHQPVMMFLARNAGYLALMVVAQAQLAGRSHEVSFASISRDLGLSRTHIRNLFIEAEAAGYVRCNPKSGQVVEISPLLWEANDRFLAGVQANQDAIARIAFANLRETNA